MTARESNASYSTKENSNNNEAYTDKSKSTGRNVGFAAAFEHITRRGAVLEDASIHTAKITVIKTAMSGIKKRKDMRCVIYTDLLKPKFIRKFSV